jgi:hypothetical protein
MKPMMKTLFVPATVILSSIAAAAQTPPPAPPEPPPPPDNVFFYQPLEKAEVLHRGAKPVANAPYQGTMMNETVQHLADGNTIQNSHTSKVARDSQGRTWREETLDRVGPWSTSSGPTTVVFITDPVAGYSYVLHPDERTASRRPMPKIVATSGQQVPSSRPGPALPPPPPPDAGTTDVEVDSFAGAAGAVASVGPGGPMEVEIIGHGEPSDAKSESLGTQEVNGVLAQGKKTTRTIAAGKIGNQLPITIITETWYSPDLHMIVMSKRTDPRFGDTTFQIENIQRGEPSADLFQLPADYTVTDGHRMRTFRRKH